MIIQQHSSGLFLDLDGTLIDSLPGIEFSIRQAVNAVLPNSNLSDIRSYIGPPIHDIFRKLVGTQSPDVEEALLRIFREVYNGEGWRQSYLYEGVIETLDKISNRGILCFVVTNKPCIPTQKILEFIGLTKYLTEIVCRDTRNPLFAAKSEMITYLLEKYCLQPEVSSFIGDSEDDAIASMITGIPFYAVDYGYGGIYDSSCYDKTVLHSIGGILEYLK